MVGESRAGIRAALGFVVALGVGCGGKVIFSPSGGYGSGGGAETGNGGAGASNGTGSTKPDLHPLCKKFCDAYQHCAPVTDCMNGCLVSAVFGCEKQYAADVVCITGALNGCNVPPDKCNAESDAYLACQMTTSSTGG